MNTDNNNFTYQLFKDFFDGNYSRDKAAETLDWMDNAVNSFKFEKYLHRLWKEMESEYSTSTADFTSLLDKVHHSIHLYESQKPGIKSRSRDQIRTVSCRKILQKIGKAAAILLIPLLAYNGWQIYNRNTWLKSQPEIVYNEIYCPLGAKSRFELPDGTKGSLNNGSTLRYPVRFTGERREVELKGEAFFDVVHNKHMPFIIKTVAIDVKVLGTRVNVYSYPDESYLEITLESGSVELIKTEEDQEIVVAEMKPGQHVLFNYGEEAMGSPSEPEGENLIIIDKQDEPLPMLSSGEKVLFRLNEGDLYLFEDKTERYTGWTDGKLILRNDPMPVLLRRMERWYSVKFNVMDERINDYTYWATFEEENLDQVLKLLALTGPLQFTKLPREQLADGTIKIQEINVTIK